MENKDFRSRLSEHTTAANPAAWKQMSEMLDAVAEGEQKKKKKRKLWWFLFPLLLLSCATFIFLLRNVGTKQPPVVSEISETVTSDRLRLPEDKVGTEASAVLFTELGKKQNSRSERLNLNEDKILNSGALSKADNAYSKTQSLASKSRNSATKNMRVADAKTIVRSQTAVLLGDETIHQAASQPNLGNQTSTIASNIPQPTSSELITGSDENEQQQMSLDPSVLALLKYSKLQSILQPSSYPLGQESKIDLPRVNKLYWTAGTGISDFNGNRGYYLGFGVFLDLDKVIGLETNLSYAASKVEIDRPNEYFLERDNQLALRLWCHLNLIKSKKHRLSLDLGPSVSYVSYERARGQRSTGDSYVSSDINGGVSYTYVLTSGDGIGLKLAFSRTDAGYAAIKYFKKFK